MAPQRLNQNEIEDALSKVEGWTLQSDREAIQRTFSFNDFKEAWGFMARCALKAEEMCHHPEWFNVYNRVEVTLATHDCSGLSKLDFELATYMNKASGQSQS